MKNLLFGLVGASLVLAACSKKTEDPAPAAPTVPEILVFSKPTVGQKLTRGQAEQIRATFSTKAAMILPPGELIFTPKEMSAAEKEKREQELKTKDVNSYALLKQIQSSCVKDRPSMHVEATFPTDGEDAKRSLRAGDYGSISANAGLGGSSCVVDVASSSGMGAKVEERDFNTDTGKASASYSSALRAVMKDTRYAQLLGSRGLIVQSNASALIVARQIATENMMARTLTQIDLTGSYLALSKDIPFSMSYKILINEKGGTEGILIATITMPDFSFRMDVYTKQVSPKLPAHSEIYLNGHPLTQADVDELFGQANPQKVANSTAAYLK